MVRLFTYIGRKYLRTKHKRVASGLNRVKTTRRVILK
jgi:hypothetical protein